VLPNKRLKLTARVARSVRQRPMLQSRTSARLVSLAYLLCAPQAEVGAQTPPQQRDTSALTSSTDSLERLLAEKERECQRPFTEPPVLPTAALTAPDVVLPPASSGIRLDADAFIDRRPPVDPGFSMFPPFRCAPRVPLHLVLRLRPAGSTSSLSHLKVDSVWIRRGTHLYAAVPARTAKDPADTDTLVTRRIQEGPIWITGPIDVFLRLGAPANLWLALHHVPLRTLR
jgi:hypothetical protein